MEHFVMYDSPLGPLLLTSDGENLTGLWVDRAYTGPESVVPVLEQAMQWLDDYFLSKPREIDFPLAMEGTAFQKTVWQLLLDIPWGTTRTYGDLARETARLLGKEKMSAQAVGQAVGANPVSIIVPCHRVVGAKGKLTGYAFGIEKKQWLLEHENTLREEEE